MYLSTIKIENFRNFGENENGFFLSLKPGLTALVGENDSGKTAVIDAVRIVLGTRDREYYKVENSDFHWPQKSESRSKEIRIHLKFEGLTEEDKITFLEYLTYQNSPDNETEIALHVHWKAREKIIKNKHLIEILHSSGLNGDGPSIHFEARSMLSSTYLRPLRDAESALSSGRSSRLSQILQNTKEINSKGSDFNVSENSTPKPEELSILGIADYINYLLEVHESIKNTCNRLNNNYLKPLSFAGDTLLGQITVSASSDKDVRLRQLLEKLELELRHDHSPSIFAKKGLGSNNLLFMACELLLLEHEESLPILLIEEPEAHLHPQRQLMLLRFLQSHCSSQDGNSRVQIILSTHSPNLSSTIKLENLVLVNNRHAYPFAKGYTKLDNEDYKFLERYLDTTKSNLFFAKAIIIVEGPSEAILLPVLAKMIGKDLSLYGVAIVNVNGTGLRRFANIYQRRSEDEPEINVPVACITDLDVMPNCAPKILELKKTEKSRWKIKSDFTDDQLNEHRKRLCEKANGQKVKTFVSEEWTLEYDLAFSGLAQEVWLAAMFADNDAKINSNAALEDEIMQNAMEEFKNLEQKCGSKEELSTNVYKLYHDGVSKPIAAQYLSNLLQLKMSNQNFSEKESRDILPKYLLTAIDYVTTDGFQ